MTERKWSLLFSDGRYGPLVDEAVARNAYSGIDVARRPFVTLTCWERVSDEDAETVPPPPAVESEIDPFAWPPCAVCGTKPSDPRHVPGIEGGHDYRPASSEARAEQITLVEEK